MKSYGTATVQDGVYSYGNTTLPRTGFVSYSDFRRETSPVFAPKASGLKTFMVDLNYAGAKYVYREGRPPFATSLPASYSRQYRRIASDRNVAGDLKSFVAQFSGCDEAHKLRKRMIALTGLHGTIASDKFRFGLDSASAPDAPRNLIATPGNMQAILSWTTPPNNGSQITDYVIQYSINGGLTWVTFSDGISTARHATVTGLANGTSHIFRVAAVNRIGMGRYANPSSSITPSGGGST